MITKTTLLLYIYAKTDIDFVNLTFTNIALRGLPIEIIATGMAIDSPTQTVTTTEI
jgi:hypothetical protein